jgi:centromeric protein E
MRRRSIRVGVRLRPADGVAAWRVDGSAVVECPRRQDAYASQQRAPRVFRFDDVFDVRADNAAVYAQVAKDVVDDALRGNSGALIAYGQTASGKTHTMQGTPESPGLIPRAVVDVFRTYQRCRVSYVESYNERVRDLLGDADDLRVLDGGPVGRREVDVESVDEVFAAITRGERRRSVGETAYNDRSSRSHAILTLTLANNAILTFVDLAGSEATASAEGHCINRSLHALALVIAKLADSSGYVPYRDSKLTRLLRPALSGRVALVCTVAPDAGEETTNTLHFARRATRVVQAPVPRASPLVARYRQQMDALQTELQAPHEVLPPEPPGPAAREGVREAIADLERLIVNVPAPVTATPVRRRGKSLPPARTLFFEPIDDDGDGAASPERLPPRAESPCSPPSRSFPATGGRSHTAAADPRSPEFPPSTPSAPMDTAALREVQRKLQDALARSEPDENLFAAAEVLERLDKSEAENKVLKAELARVSTILASRERELVKMKGLASPEDEVF